MPDQIDEGDRHVAATAIAAHANVIVTANLRHFPSDALIGYDIAIQGPDEFLVHQLGLSSTSILQVLQDQAAALTAPSLTVTELLDRLRQGAPQFVTEVEFIIDT